MVVDWQNVTAGHDIDIEWGASGDFFVRHGWIWVGASVQRVGVNGATTGATANLGLKEWNPTRYGPLDLTDGGTVLGGIRLPKVTVPVALDNGANGPASLTNPLSLFCVLYGTHVRFDQTKLALLYPTHGSYVSKVAKAGQDLVAQGFLLREDAQTLLTDASRSDIGK